MRILLVTNDYPPKPGGIQQYLGSIVDHSDADFLILGPHHPGAIADPRIVRGHAKWMLPSRRTRRWIEDCIDDFAPHVIVFGAPTPLAQLGPRLALRKGVPYVVIAHGGEVTLPAAVPGARQILSRTFRHAAAVLTVSEFTARRVGRLGAQKVRVLGAGVDLALFTPTKTSDAETLVLVCVSRFIPRKGQVRVIKAADELAASGIPTEVLIVGKGRLEPRIRRAAARASVRVRIEVDVSWDELPSLYAQGDIYVMPARSRFFGLDVEGLGIVYLEASATGLPVVAGRSGGAPETVVPGQTGYLAESVTEIVEAVQAIGQDRVAMGNAARARVEAAFSWSGVGERFDRFLSEVVP